MVKSKIVLYIAMSADGYISRSNGSVDWLDKYNKGREDYGYKDFFDAVDNVIVGNTTQKQFPQSYPGKKCYVFSRRKIDPENGINYVWGDVRKFVEKHGLKGISWIVGGSDLFNQFLKHGLVDEFMIFVMPELLGRGIPLFLDKGYMQELKLLKSKSYGSGVVLLHYKL